MRLFSSINALRPSAFSRRELAGRVDPARPATIIICSLAAVDPRRENYYPSKAARSPLSGERIPPPSADGKKHAWECTARSVSRVLETKWIRRKPRLGRVSFDDSPAPVAPPAQQARLNSKTERNLTRLLGCPIRGSDKGELVGNSSIIFLFPITPRNITRCRRGALFITAARLFRNDVIATACSPPGRNQIASVGPRLGARREPGTIGP